jgi:hypothetical protein
MDTIHRFEPAPRPRMRTVGFFLCGVMLLLAGCGSGSGSGSSGNNIIVTMTNKISSVQAGTVAVMLLATVQNDSTNSGVTWSLTANGAACSPSCGTLSLATPASVTYTPPGSGPAAPNNQPTLTATSVAKTNKSDADAFTITAALAVAIANKFSSVNTGSSPFVVNATVQNDPTKSGVSWTLTTNGAVCTAACGALSGITATGATYSPPASVPVPPNVTLTATSLHDASKSDSANFTIQQAPIAVVIQGKIASVPVGGSSVFFAANVQNDPFNAGTTWKLTANGTDCTASTCGTLSPAGTASIIYNPPSSLPAAPNDRPTLTGISKTDTTKSDSNTFTITAGPPISVTITRITSILGSGTGVELSAFVQNDFSNSGVTWTLTCFPPATNCGALSPGGSTTTATYTPQASAPAQATVQAFSKADNTPSQPYTFNITSTVANGCSGMPTGQESLLKGHYALQFEGFWSAGNGVPILLTASFQADGTGGITGGEEDINDTISPQHFTFSSSGSLYTVGADRRGCLQLTNTGGTTTVFRFALGGINSGTASKGRIIEFDDNSGTGAGSRGSGILRQQDPNAFVLSALQNRYAFGVDGWGMDNNQLVRFSTAGAFSNSSGTLTNGVYDLNFAGVTEPDSTGLTSGTNPMHPISPTTGRTTGSFDFFDWAIYIVNSSEFFVVSTDPISFTVSAGRAIATSSSFTAASLSGNYVVHATGNTNSSADVNLDLWSMTPGGAQTGTLSGTVNSYGAGNGAQTTTLNGITYNVDATSGRTILGNPGDNLPILYLTTPTDGIAAFVVGVGADALFGVAEPQTSPALAAGTYTFGTEDPSDDSAPNRAGVETIASGGALTGTYDQSNTSGLQSGQAVGATVSLSSNGVGNIGPNTVAITTGSKLFSVDETGGTAGPAVIVVAEQ